MKTDQPSATAFLIAESLAAFAADKTIAPLLPPNVAELSRLFAQANGRARFFDLKQTKFARMLLTFLENRTIPGIRLHYLLRKLQIETVARRALREGFEQVVIFGAGFDTLALRLHKEFPAARFVEFDYPATQNVKRAVIAKQNLAGANLFFEAVDLTAIQTRRAPILQPNARTLFVAEGLLMYFARAKIARLFDFARANCAPESRFAFTFMEKQADGAIRFQNSARAVDWWLKQKGEPFKSGFEKNELAAFLNARGYKPQSFAAARDLRRNFLIAPELEKLKSAVGESLCVAEKV